jgi:molybdopterin/thiamine biosynthesis adenylyltransferase/rhodanese-related sulfurtransferase
VNKRELSESERVRYGRHLVLPKVGEEGQLRLKEAKVLCVGAGGLGSPVLMYLAAAGVGEIGVVDFDIVDQSNLQRQIIHGESDIGTPKIESAAQFIHALNSETKINLYPDGLKVENALEIIQSYDLVVDATDNFATRYLINDACYLAKKPCIWGSVYRFDGQVSIFCGPEGPCYRCLHPEPPAKELAPNCATGGVFGALCGTIGSLQATEVIKIITGVGSPLIGSLLTYDALSAETELVNINPNPNCVLCGDQPTQRNLLADYDSFCSISLFNLEDNSIAEIYAPDLSAMQNSATQFQLIDVREEEEWNLGFIEGALLIPQGEIFDGSAFEKITHDYPVVLYCQSGVRSLNCAQNLLNAGYTQVVILAGGFQAWVQFTLPV